MPIAHKIPADADDAGTDIRNAKALEAKNSELSAALERLKASEERLLPLERSIAAMLEGIQIIDPQWRYVYLNATAARQGRPSTAKLVGRTMMECYPGIEATPVFGVLTAVMETRAPQRLQTEFVFPDGTSGWFELSVEPDPNGILLRSMDITEHRHVEVAFRASEARYRRLFETAKDGILILDAQTGKIEDANPFLIELLGYSHAEFLGKQLWEIGAFKDITANKAAFEELQRTRFMRYENLPLETKGGSQIEVEFVSNAYDVDGRQIIQCNIRDNTSRKQVEVALLKAGALQSAIFNSANFSCIATDAKGVIQIFNVGAERMLGYTTAEVVNRITPAELHDSQEVVARASALSLEFATAIAPGFEALVFKAARGIEDIYELTKIRKDGSRFPAVVSVTALRDASGAIIGYLLIGTDNTARRQVEEERKMLDERLRESEQRFRGFVTASSDVVYRMSPDWSEMRQLHGQNFIVDTDAASGTWFQEYIHPDDQPHVMAVIQEAIRTKSTFELEHRVRTADGGMGWTFSRAIPMLDVKGEIVEWFGAASDVSGRKLLEESLQQKNIELEQASRMKSEFLANMSHELRTPLNSIVGFSELLRDGLIGEMTDKQRGFIGDIFSSGKHLLSLINDILDLSKVEAGKMMLDLEPVLVSTLLANCLSIVREKAAAHQIRLEMDAPRGLGAVQADARKVKQIVYNLLSNAVKFTAEGGLVTLRACRVPRAEVGRFSGTGRRFPLAESAFEDFLAISVTDSGIGISVDGLERLFKPFSQIDSGLSRKFEGTGLGLAMVKLLAELHDGAVAVESAEGKGSCFTVWLPWRAPERVALTPGKAAGTPRIEGPKEARTALVVEDDYKSADLIRLHLEAEGFKVLHAASAEAALVLAMQQPVSLITLDILLPNMEGWEFLSRLKNVPALQRTPVVIISIVADPNKGIALGASAVLQKPISRQELYESLVDLGLFPLSRGQSLKVLVVDDDPKAVELIALGIQGLASTVLRAYGGREAIETTRRELPDVIVLDLMMPEVTGFDVVAALNEHPDTACIPVMIVTAKQITAGDRTKLSRYVATITEKAEFDPDHFTAEVRRAMSGRAVGSLTWQKS
jgi:PAS domain S-box-containing protein